ncbi:unnamed protein product [Linum trigynum]|uniref:Uncharacterized protein n=1 Tax=Linum trigynum TaxID=586398 RepID=A0AAV2E4B7_9ROSI
MKKDRLDSGLEYGDFQSKKGNGRMPAQREGKAHVGGGEMKGKQAAIKTRMDGKAPVFERGTKGVKAATKTQVDRGSLSMDSGRKKTYMVFDEVVDDLLSSPSPQTFPSRKVQPNLSASIDDDSEKMVLEGYVSDFE